MDFTQKLQIQYVSKLRNLCHYLAHDLADAEEQMLSLITNLFFESQVLFRNLVLVLSQVFQHTYIYFD
jgi:hypothetical protein